MILEQASEWTRRHLLKIQIGVGVLVFLFILALSLNPPPRVVIRDEKPTPDYQIIKPIEALEASLLPRMATITTTTLKPYRQAPVSSDNAPAGWFQPGQCTHHVWTKRPVGKWNDATSWLWQAKRDGYTVSNTPQAGAIAWTYGHVAYVEAVKGNQVLISEANYDYQGSVRTIWVPTPTYKYIY